VAGDAGLAAVPAKYGCDGGLARGSKGSKVPVTLGSHNLMHGNELRRVGSFRRFASDPNANIARRGGRLALSG